MPATSHTPDQIRVDGVKPTEFTPTVTQGDSFANAGSTLMEVNNGSGAPITVTITPAGAAAGSGSEDAVVTTVPAGERRMIGPFPPARFGATVTAICSAVTDVTAAVIKFR